METKPIETICIVGAGFMGAQIGLQCAVHGHAVWLSDVSEQALERAARAMARELDERIEAGEADAGEREATLARVYHTTDLTEAAADADLVIEAVPERLALKREVFGTLDRICPRRTILATNSSSIRVSRIEDVTERPDRVLNLHFYGQVWRRPMVELMGGTATSDETIERVRRFARGAGLVPLLVRQESTGFIFNRVWRAIKKECLHLVDAGVASHEDVDRAWMIFTGMSIGPFGRMDMIGLDVVRDIEMVYYRESGDESDAPPRLLLDKTERGELGVKTGKGFYTYPDPAYRDPGWLESGTGYLQSRPRQAPNLSHNRKTTGHKQHRRDLYDV
jgi:3-hydroxybutyryl-CoA dehydrogenase